jgi:tetratricopeptide (TPR) repeat protein
MDVIQEIGKICYTLEEYPQAWVYYEKLIAIRSALQLEIYHNEDANIAFVLEQLGREKEAEPFYESYLDFANKDQSIYKDLIFSGYYAAKGDIEKGMEYMKAFTQQRNYQYWFVLFLERDPILSKMKNHPDYKSTIEKILATFWEDHEELKAMLVERDIMEL